MRKLILALPLLLTVCDVEPVFADPDPAPTVEDVLGVMHRLPEERCIYREKSNCRTTPGRYDRGPDARRIAQAIVANADGSLTGTRALDAAVYATYSSYESGNDASAVGDHGRAHGPWQIWFVSEAVATDPMQAAPVWRSIAASSMATKACAALPEDERLAGLAGSCSYQPARRKVRLRMQAARDALSSR